MLPDKPEIPFDLFDFVRHEGISELFAFEIIPNCCSQTYPPQDSLPGTVESSPGESGSRSRTTIAGTSNT